MQVNRPSSLPNLHACCQAYIVLIRRNSLVSGITIILSRKSSSQMERFIIHRQCWKKLKHRSIIIGVEISTQVWFCCSSRWNQWRSRHAISQHAKVSTTYVFCEPATCITETSGNTDLPFEPVSQVTRINTHRAPWTLFFFIRVSITELLLYVSLTHVMYICQTTISYVVLYLSECPWHLCHICYAQW